VISFISLLSSACYLSYFRSLLSPLFAGFCSSFNLRYLVIFKNYTCLLSLFPYIFYITFFSCLKQYTFLFWKALYGLIGGLHVKWSFSRQSYVLCSLLLLYIFSCSSILLNTCQDYNVHKFMVFIIIHFFYDVSHFCVI
jgi:hypothetical protein